MRKPKTITVQRGRVVGEGATKTLANADLASKIDFLCHAEGAHIEVRFGLVLIVCSGPTAEWSYQVVDPAHEREGKVFYQNGLGGNLTMRQAISRVRLYAAQRDWKPQIGDDEGFIARAECQSEQERDLRHWIKWQRSYADLIKAGKTHAEAHQQATGY
ncbi:hypothetical protein HAP48_0042800 [Bradyrhizobium septentrionale]|uniref:Uncharacterized protein n=1 Tax=Bradyrhizobium septentrionale TaxID=1404411 RepID=A0A974A3M9_9BRAD|nr:hypothetical protein [Bradyrhizobium septentrionale]UGY15188.1 hypothetical protein HAP48_0042800 [Bradyrhizobium septentrionale]